MEMLEGAMAFAVAMIVFSTVVTGIVEALLRFVAMRQRALGKALERFLENELMPRARDVLIAKGKVEAGAKNAKAYVDEFLARMTGNPVEIDEEIKSFFKRRPWWSRRVDRVDQLTTYSFLQRLAKTEVGEALIANDDKGLEAALTDISRTYERYVAASHEYLRKRSNVLTTIISIGFAFFFNVDAGRVYQHLMDSPDARAALIAQAEDAAVQNDAAVHELRLLLEDISAAEAGGDQAVDKKIEDLKADLAPLIQDGRLPIGPAHWPYCWEGPAADPAKCGAAKTPWQDYGYWVFNVLLAGILIGLGGPFWHKVYTSLASLTAFTRFAKGKSETIDGNAPEQTLSRAALEEGDLVKAFRIAAREVERRLN